MRLADILGLALAALWQQKVRTALTLLGVVFGGFVLAASLSINQGIQDTIEREANRSNYLRKITVRPRWRAADGADTNVPVPGKMDEAKRQRLRKALQDYRLRFAAETTREPLTAAKLKALAELPHVQSVTPLVWLSGRAFLPPAEAMADVASAAPDHAGLRKRLLAGRFFDGPAERTIVVSEFLLYRLGLIDDEAALAVVGKQLRLELRGEERQAGFGIYLMKPQGEVTAAEAAAVDKVREQLPAALDRLDLTAAEKELLRKAVKPPPANAARVLTEDYTVAGVLRLSTDEEQRDYWDMLGGDADVYLPLQTATDLFFRVPGPPDRGVEQATVLVDHEEHVKEVAERIRALGFETRAALEFIERERLMYLLIFGAMTCVAAVALLVAALGIANTMLMSVLERTREIGIMKAVGAANSHLLVMFLVEGALLGGLGGGLGLLLAWGASFPADAWVRGMVARDLKIELEEPIFAFPAWLAGGVLLFAVAVTTLAAVYPARRAARIDPVAALRHE
jgi:putative ABC transport system permease protein